MKRIMVLVVGMAACLQGQALLGQDEAAGRPGPGPRHGRGIGEAEMVHEAMINGIVNNPDKGHAAKLGLTEEQIRTLREKWEVFRREHIRLRAESELAGMDQAKLMTQDKVAEADVMKAVEKTGSINTEIAKLKVKQLLLLKNVLTQEQIQKIRELVRARIAKHRENERRAWGRHGDDGNPGASRKKAEQKGGQQEQGGQGEEAGE